MKEVWKNVLSNIISNILILLWGTMSAMFIAIINENWIPYIVISICTILIIILYLLLRDSVRFKWGHIYTKESHRLLLKSDGSGIDTINFDTKIQKGFTGKICGDYVWDDVSVNKVELQSDNADIMLNCFHMDGNESFYEGKNIICIEREPISANYVISYIDDNPQEVKLEVVFDYNPEKMCSEYFVEVYRPMRKLILELYVADDVKLHKVKKLIESDYGDIKRNPERIIKFNKIPGYKSYKYKIRNPKLFHKYKIKWEWNK